VKRLAQPPTGGIVAALSQDNQNAFFVGF